MTPRVEVQRASEFEPIPRTHVLRRWGLAALSALSQPGSLCIRVIDEAESRRLNGAYRGQDRPTNVLSFPAEMTDPDSQERLLGDVAICAPVVAAEAEEQHKRLLDHWAHVVVHGVLHLLGYDHRQEAEAAQMEGLEIEILAGMGIADPYVDPYAA